MKYLLLILKNWNTYSYWRKVKKGIKPVELIRGPGYYFTTGLLGFNPIGTIEELPMRSGKVGIYELVGYILYRDPSDMIEKSYWHFLGYKGMKPVNECSFPEMVQLYKMRNI